MAKFDEQGQEKVKQVPARPGTSVVACADRNTVRTTKPIHIPTETMDYRYKQDLRDLYSNAEWRAIEEHKYYLSLEAGYDVGEPYAVRHWEGHHAKTWRRERLKRELAAQQREILKHKWLESEKACTDLGQQAVHDWIVRFAKPWRQWHRGQETK